MPRLPTEEAAMPTLTYDRGHNSHDFTMADLESCEGLEVVQDQTGKVWVNVNGKCLFRAGYAAHFSVENKKKK